MNKNKTSAETARAGANTTKHDDNDNAIRSTCAKLTTGLSDFSPSPASPTAMLRKEILRVACFCRRIGREERKERRARNELYNRMIVVNESEGWSGVL